MVKFKERCSRTCFDVQSCRTDLQSAVIQRTRSSVLLEGHPPNNAYSVMIQRHKTKTAHALCSQQAIKRINYKN